MVGFEYHNPDFPFAMGGMFHGNIALGGGINNHLKSIQTRSGIRILMNDAEGSVNIIDPSGNTYFMDGQGNISVTAPKNMTFNAGENVSINAGQNVSVIAGTNIMTSATLNYTQTVGINYTSSIAGNASHFITGKLMEMIDGDVISESKKDRKEYSTQDMEVQSEGNIKKYSQKTVYNNGGEKSNSH